MKFVFLAATLFAAVFAAESIVDELTEPQLTVTASFPEDNPFGHVTNGEANAMSIYVENSSDQNITIIDVAGSFHQVDTDTLIKNTTALTYGVYLIPGTKITLPYAFHSELKPGDTRLHLWINHAVKGTKYRVSAYDSVITVVEAPLSIFDWKLLSTYLITLAFIAGTGYFAYQSFFPTSTLSKSKRTRKPKVPQEISAPVGTVTATGAGGYQEEWIPEHHLKKARSAKGGNKSDGGAVSSGDEGIKRGKKRS